jgi:hypothetical protein
MGITIVFSWKTVLQQTSWSVGYCVRCDRFEAIRVGDAVQIISAWEFPVGRSVLGKAACCDCCESPAGPMPEALIIPSGEWSPAQGIRSLFEKCCPKLLPNAPQLTSDSEIRALLKLVQRRSSVESVDIGVGLVAGVLIGAALALSVGLYLANQEGSDSFGAGFVALMIGAVFGSIVGSFVEAILKGRKLARRMILAAYQKYQLAPDRLTALARSYRHRIRSAVRFALQDDLVSSQQ